MELSTRIRAFALDHHDVLLTDDFIFQIIGENEQIVEAYDLKRETILLKITQTALGRALEVSLGEFKGRRIVRHLTPRKNLKTFAIEETDGIGLGDLRDVRICLTCDLENKPISLSSDGLTLDIACLEDEMNFSESYINEQPLH